MIEGAPRTNSRATPVGEKGAGPGSKKKTGLPPIKLATETRADKEERKRREAEQTKDMEEPATKRS